jgi:ABC-2 type transport system ATP-binding protein
MSDVIVFEGLRKEFRSLRRGATVALDGLNLLVPAGGVFGFLGPNGAGKTTAIRCLLGHVRSTDGRIRLLGADVPGGLAASLRRVGAIVEAPALFPRFSGRTNLRILARIDGIDDRRVDGVLAKVGLADRAHDVVRAYSLGMKQRLAIAAALLKDPEILVLDEPANGLDPAGIVEVRELLRRLGAEGRTVFVSSHLLSEVQLIADRVAILSRGRCIRQGAVDEVLAAGGERALIVRLRDLDAGRDVLAGAGFPVTIADGALRVEAPDDAVERVSRTLGERALYITELRREEADLERAFLDLTREADHPTLAPGTDGEL